jgi:hypothetical protein
MIGTEPGSLAPIWQNSLWVCLAMPDGLIGDRRQLVDLLGERRIGVQLGLLPP